MKKLLPLMVCLLFFFPAASFATSSASPDNIDRTVLVEVECPTYSGHGSGFILEGNKVITAKHVVDDVEECLVFVTPAEDFLPGVREKHRYSAVVLVASDKHDVALLVSSKDFGITTELAPAELGEAITVIGFPAQPRDRNGLYLTVTRGWISAVWVDGLHDITARVYFGNSGGPVFNEDGDVVGIAVMLYSNRHGVAFYYALPAETICEFLSAG